MSDRTAEQLQAEQRFHAKLLSELDAAVVAWDADARVTHYSAGAERLYGWRAQDMIGRPLDWGRRLALPPAGPERGEGWHGELEVPTADGSSMPVWMRISPLHAPGGTLEGFISVAVDMTERKHAAQQLERRIAQQAAVAALGERALEGLASDRLKQMAVELLAENLDVQVSMFLAYDGLRRIVAGEGVGVPDTFHDGWEMDIDAPRPTALVVRTGVPVVIEDWLFEERFGPQAHEGFTSGSSMLVAVKGREVTVGALLAHAAKPHAFTRDDLHFLQSMANVLSDAIERERVERAVRYQALHDRITGLPNRTLLQDRLAHALALGGRRRRDVAVLFLDLDHFKLVNDTLGHAAGDDVLQQVAPRLSAAVRPADTVARFGGDEFVLLCEDVEEHGATAIARRVLAAFAAPFVLAGQDHYLTCSVGIALSGHRGDTPDGLVRDADAAMYRAKERGGGRYEIFDEDLRHRALARLRIEADLRRAIDHGQLELHYQPIVALASGRVTGVEALARWRHPQRGLLGAGAFVPVAEETGLIVPLTRWVLGEALTRLAGWRARHPQLTVSVNVSIADVSRPDFADVVVEALAACGLPPEALSLEIVEAALLDPSEGAVRTLRRLGELGCSLALDDVGTGCWSLRRLDEVPIGALKLDRAFVGPLGDGAGGSALARAVMGLARALDLTVVAEGVETAAQEARLLELGCPAAQGHRYAAPLAPADCEPLLAQRLPPDQRAAPGGAVPVRPQEDPSS